MGFRVCDDRLFGFFGVGSWDTSYKHIRINLGKTFASRQAGKGHHFVRPTSNNIIRNFIITLIKCTYLQPNNPKPRVRKPRVRQSTSYYQYNVSKYNLCQLSPRALWFCLSPSKNQCLCLPIVMKPIHSCLTAWGKAAPKL